MADRPETDLALLSKVPGMQPQTSIDGRLRVEIYQSPNFEIFGQYFSTSGTVIVVFGPRSSQFRPFGDPMFARYGINVIHFTCRGPQWYQYSDAEAAGRALGRAAAAFDYIVTYGASMGGYGALLFARHAGAHMTLAISPQYSMDPAKAPFEHRFDVDVFGIFDAGGFIFDDIAAGINPKARTVVVYDPISLDTEHVKLIRACGPIEELVVPFSGHGPLRVMAEMGLASRLVREAATGKFDRHAMRRNVRERRNLSASYLRNAARILDRRRRQGALTLLRRAAEQYLPEDVSKIMEDISRLIVHKDIELAKNHLKALLDNDMFVGDPRHVSSVINVAPVLAVPLTLLEADAALRPRMQDGNRATRMSAALMLAAVQTAVGELDVARETLAFATGSGADADLPIESARLRVALGDNDTAIAIGQAAHSADRGNAEIAEFLAVLLEKENDPASALAVLRGADSVLPLQVRQHRLHLARLLHKAGERAESIDHCDRILATDPVYVPALRLRARLFVEAHRHSEAIGDYKVLSGLPQSAGEGFLGLARTLSLAGDKKAAMAAAQEVLRLEPGRREMIRLVDQLGRRQD